MESTNKHNATIDHEPLQATNMIYTIAMFIILAVGFLGNVLTLIVLNFREHRRKTITPLMANLAIADLFIIAFGYPVVITSNLLGKKLEQAEAQCMWSGFSNGVAGISSIATLVCMSGLMYYVIKQTVLYPRIPPGHMIGLITGSWLYGLLLNCPPLLGWNQFVPGKAGFSCAPDWTATDLSSLLYVLLLVVFGFFIPLAAICIFYYVIFRLIKEEQESLTSNKAILARRRKSQMKLVRMTGLAISAFVLSWSPYCFVSLAGTIQGQHVLTTGEAEIPELMAKASVIFNPLVYTVMNSSFRATLWRVVRRRHSFSRDNSFTLVTMNSRVHGSAVGYRWKETTAV